MKFKIQLKDPDVLHEAIDEALEDLEIEGLSEEELEAVKEKRKDIISDMCADWFEYGEYLTVEVDTEEGTIRVVPVNEK